jgi:translation initiation factor IF-3
MDIDTELMINEEIRDKEVRLIDQNGGQLGIMPTRRALELAEEAQLDLVKIVPNAQPPVCKLIDYDKHRFEQAKRERELRKNQKIVSLKEVQLSATIEENDVQTKAKSAIRFLQEGDKVKVSIRFRGRQISHSEIGMKVMADFIERTKDYSSVERRPLLDGRHMIMILAPKAEKESFAERSAKARAAAGAQQPAAAANPQANSPANPQ